MIIKSDNLTAESVNAFIERVKEEEKTRGVAQIHFDAHGAIAVWNEENE